MVSLNRLRISIRKGKAYPAFANEGLKHELDRARNCYERKLGCRLQEFDEEEIEGCFSDRKIGEAGRAVLGRFYSFRGRDLGDLLSQEEMDHLSKMGIESCMDLRLAFFEFLSKDHAGFMSSESRQQLLHEFAEEVVLEPEQLEEALWVDEEENKVLARVVDEPPRNLEAVYNFEVLSTILCNSLMLKLGPVQDGSTIKFVFRNLKFYGLLFDLIQNEDGLIFDVVGPVNLFGKSSKFGYRMSILLYRLRQLSMRRPFDCPLSVEFKKSRRRVTFEANISTLPELAWPNVGELKFHLFDSKVEAKVYSTFKAIDLGGWQVDREPKPIVFGDSVFIPDFSLKRGDVEVFIEVIGFWVPEYRRRKRVKLGRMQKDGFDNLLLLVDEKLKKDFEAITKFPIFTYSRKGSSYRIPYSRILGFLEAKYPGGRSSAARKEGLTEPTYVQREDGTYKVFW